MIRTAVPADVPAIHAMIRELAEYERSLEHARATEEQLHSALFGPHPAAFALIAEAGTAEAAGSTGATGSAEAAGIPSGVAATAGENGTYQNTGTCEEGGGGEPVGFALWFRNFSTWNGTHGVYLEDLYVRPAARGGGHGKALLAALARLCVERGYERFEWWVLNWNEPSIGFYKSLGAEPMDEWTVFRLTGAPLRALADMNAG